MQKYLQCNNYRRRYRIQGSLRPTCVYWDIDDNDWSQTGCHVDLRRSTSKKTVCQCNHLTNFGIIFGDGDADDPVLSLISIILGIISCSCLVVTVFFLHWLR